jgi:hypothetical protein
MYQLPRKVQPAVEGAWVVRHGKSTLAVLHAKPSILGQYIDARRVVALILPQHAGHEGMPCNLFVNVKLN